jgi:hypothetical protein
VASKTHIWWNQLRTGVTITVDKFAEKAEALFHCFWAISISGIKK